jgi:predicted DNA repair protein MutK
MRFARSTSIRGALVLFLHRSIVRSSMAAPRLLALIDDITTVLDDVALMTEAAAKKTAGVMGDGLALNAEQVSGVRADRELPVVWAVFLGSLKNKASLVHGLPWLHALINGVSPGAEAIPRIGVILAGVTPTLVKGIVGTLAGALALSVVAGGQKVWRGVRPEQA